MEDVRGDDRVSFRESCWSSLEGDVGVSGMAGGQESRQ